MWIWIIIGAVVIGAIFGALNPRSSAGEGAVAGGCMAVSCLGRLALAAIGIIAILWLFGVIF